MLETRGYRDAEWETAWKIFSSIVDDREIPDLWTSLKILHVALGVSIYGLGFWSLAWQSMNGEIARQVEERLREQSSTMNGEKHAVHDDKHAAYM